MDQEMMDLVNTIFQALHAEFKTGNWALAGPIEELDLDDEDTWSLYALDGFRRELVDRLFRVRVQLIQFACTTLVYVAFPKADPLVLDFFHEDHTLAHHRKLQALKGYA